MNKFNQDEFISRNKGLISEEIQEKISKTRLLLIGVGLGSQVAVLAARTGFEKFILCDGDAVELNNLNRQAFELSDIGKNKAEITKERILNINPNCEVEVYPKFVSKKEEVKKLITKSDIIINMADPGNIVYEINKESQNQGKPVFFPLNFAYGAYVLVFSPSGPSLEKITGKSSENDFFSKLVINTLKFRPEVLKDRNFADIQKLYTEVVKQKKPFPQCGMSSNITSSIIVREIIKWLERLPQEFAPRQVVISPWK
jgi:molybdopterin/thiamine biosynthesis adenylyltransferase